MLGNGIGNNKDSTPEKLANKGHRNYADIDTFQEAQRVLAAQLAGTLFTVAQEAKLQIEFNAAIVFAYRFIGYENQLFEHAISITMPNKATTLARGLDVHHTRRRLFNSLKELVPYDG